jgi:CRP-like cAMP-binding protein
VFDYGTIGDLFYIILKGSAKVFIPNKEKLALLQKNKSPIANAKEQANKKKAEDKHKDKKDKKEEEKKNEEDKDTVGDLPNSNLKPKGNTRRRSSLVKGFGSTLGHQSFNTLLDEPIFEQVLKLVAGQSFGELALIKNKPRAARIVCDTD